MDITLEEKALFIRNIALLVLGPLVLYANLLGNNIRTSLVLVALWIPILYFSHKGYQAIANGEATTKAIRFYRGYNLPQKLLLLRLHKILHKKGQTK